MITVSLLRHLRFPILRYQPCNYQVENGHDRDGLGSEDNYFWKTSKERSLDVSVGAGGTDNMGLNFYNTDFTGGNIEISIDDAPELG